MMRIKIPKKGIVESIVEMDGSVHVGDTLEFAVRVWSEGPDYLLVEYSRKLSILAMGSPRFKIYEGIMPMGTFAGKFVSDLSHFLTDEGKRKRWHKPWLPKKGKLEAKQLLKMIDEYNGKSARRSHSRRGAARIRIFRKKKLENI